MLQLMGKIFPAPIFFFLSGLVLPRLMMILNLSLRGRDPPDRSEKA